MALVGEIESFKDKYTSTSKSEPGKTALSDDFFAIGELLYSIIDKLERLRLSH